jgi:hypothetical protein
MNTCCAARLAACSAKRSRETVGFIPAIKARRSRPRYSCQKLQVLLQSPSFGSPIFIFV